MEYQMLHFH